MAHFTSSSGRGQCSEKVSYFLPSILPFIESILSDFSFYFQSWTNFGSMAKEINIVQNTFRFDSTRRWLSIQSKHRMGSATWELRKIVRLYEQWAIVECRSEIRNTPGVLWFGAQREATRSISVTERWFLHLRGSRRSLLEWLFYVTSISQTTRSNSIELPEVSVISKWN